MNARLGGSRLLYSTAASAVLCLCGPVFAQLHSAPEPAPMDPILLGAPMDRDTLYLATERISTAERVPMMELDEAVGAAGVRDRFVIQLDGPMTRDRRAALIAAGVTIHDYVPANAYVVELAGADGQAVADLGFVQWHSPYLTEWKVSPQLGQRVFTTPGRQQLAEQGKVALIVTLFAGEDPAAAVDDIFDAVNNASVYYSTMVGDQGEISVSMDVADVGALVALESVQFIEDAPELTLRNGTTRWLAQSNSVGVTPVYDAGIHGEGQSVGVMDGRPDTAHCSLDGGKFTFYGPAPGADFHGTHVSCTVAGDDTTNSNGRGIAYEADLTFLDVPSFTDAAMYANLSTLFTNGSRIFTNSWGDDGTTNYNSLCRGIDRFSHDFEDGLVLFAVTNQGTLRNPDNSKNLLAVGKTQDTPSQGTHCSGGVGPTSDGRRKPEIYLPGCGTQSALQNSACSYVGRTGTSMACPAVAGSCALVRQYFTDGFYPSGLATPLDAFTPSGALMKATVLNSSVDMTGVTGYPSNLEGWGRVLLDDTLHFDGDTQALFVEDVRNANGLSTTDVVEHTINVDGSSPRLKVTLVWTEPPASASTGSNPAWINDLNLEVVGPSGTYLGNFFSGGQSTAGGTADDRNNVEMVLLNAPSVGAYTVRIVASAVNDGPQGYALVVSGDINLGPSPLRANLLSSVPSIQPLNTPLTVEVNVDENDDTILGVNLHYSDDNGGSFTTIPMTSKAVTFSADVPGFDECADQPAFYVTVEGTLAGVVEVPVDGSTSPITYALGSETIAFSDDGETDQGWTPSGTATNGHWDRGIPVNGGRGDPPADFDGSGQCWLTQNDLGPSNDGNSDIDSGTVVLTSSVIDATGGGTLTYAYWFGDIPNGELDGDAYTVEIATNAAGDNWSVERTYTTALQAWRTDSFSVPDTATLRLRVTASDEGNQNVVEAGLDAVKIASVQCVDVPPPGCLGDIDGDGDTDVLDFSGFGSAFGSNSGDGNYNPDADFDNDGDVDVLDFGVFGLDFGCVPS